LNRAPSYWSSELRWWSADRHCRSRGAPAPIVEDREAAQALRGEELLVARDQAPGLEEDEWWAEDLEGCEVTDGVAVVGSVRRLLALPSCEVLEVARPSGPDLLVPLIGDAVRSVDIDRRVIDVDLGFLGEA
jgi:16S rRNA processing protein RimM